MSARPSPRGDQSVRLRALVLDFDGLILDTERTAFAIWRELYARFGQELSLELWGQLIGTSHGGFDPRAHLDALVGRALDWGALNEQLREEELRRADALAPMPGVARLFDAAERAGLRLAVASSSSRAWVTRHLERLGLLARLSSVSTREDVQRTKPDPALYLHALAVLGLEGPEAVAFEDSAHGVLAAKGAGMKVVAVPSPLLPQADFSPADLRVGSLEEFQVEVLLGEP